MKIIEHCTLLLSHTNTSVQITISSGLGDFVPSGLFPVGSNLPTIFSPDSRQTAGRQQAAGFALAVIPVLEFSLFSG